MYGLFGVDGLLHCTLALCSEHTLAPKVTIWAEVLLGVALAGAVAVRCDRLSFAQSPAAPGGASASARP